MVGPNYTASSCLTATVWEFVQKKMCGKTSGRLNVLGSRMQFFFKFVGDIMSGWQNVSSKKFQGVKMSVRQTVKMLGCHCICKMLGVKMSENQPSATPHVGWQSGLRLSAKPHPTVCSLGGGYNRPCWLIESLFR